MIGPPIPKYGMRYTDILREGVALQYMGQYAEKAYPIYRNANAATFHNLINSTQYTIRGLLDTRRGDVYFWDAYAAPHVTIKNELGLVEPMHLVLYPDSVMIVPTRGASSPPLTLEMAEPVRKNRNIQRIFGRDPQVFVMGFENEEE